MSQRPTTHLSPSPRPPREWQQHGSCRDADADLFFPPFEVESTGARHAREAEAKAVCAGCPVLEECRAWVLAVDEPHGIWGGLTESERRELLYGRRAS